MPSIQYWAAGREGKGAPPSRRSDGRLNDGPNRRARRQLERPEPGVITAAVLGPAGESFLFRVGRANRGRRLSQA